MIDSLFGRGAGLMALSFYSAYILTILPLGSYLSEFRPEWVMLLVVFWGQVLPGRFGMFPAFVVGILMDVLMAETLGTYAFCFVFILYLQLWLNSRLRMLATVQQMIKIFILSIIFLISLRLAQNFFGDPVPMHLSYWFVAISNTLIWPWLSIALDGIKNRWGVYDAL